MFDAAVAQAGEDGNIVVSNEAFNTWAGVGGDAMNLMRVESRGDGGWLHRPGRPRVAVRLVALVEGGCLVLPGQDEGRSALDAVVATVVRRLERVEQSLEANASMALRERPDEAVSAAIRETLALGQELRVLRRQIAGLTSPAGAYRETVCVKAVIREAVLNISGSAIVDFGTLDEHATIDVDRERLFAVFAGLIGCLQRRAPEGARLRVDVRAGDPVRLTLVAPGKLRVPVSGLELEAARSLAADHDGRLLVDPDQGIIIEFPAYRTEPGMRVSGGTVLVVDDDESVLAMMSAVLRRAGFTVLEADNGVAAAALLRDHADHIVALVVDAVLPGMGGVELAQEARRVVRTAAILLVTGHDDDLVGNPDFPRLIKPFTAVQLVDRVRALTT